MKALLILAALLAGTAHADEMVYKAGDTTVRLQGVDCQTPFIAEALEKHFKLTARNAVVTVKGSGYDACWVLSGDKVIILDGDMDGGYIPVTAFVRDQGI